MSDPSFTPSFSILLQRFFVEYLGRQRAVSPRTITAYRDTFRLLLTFAAAKIGKSPAALKLVDLDAKLILSFLDHLEKERNNGADLSMKERALERLQPTGATTGRYRPPDQLMQFLQRL